MNLDTDFNIVALNVAMKMFRPKCKEWSRIGKELEVDTAYRFQLMEQDDLSSEKKLEAMLSKWLESRSFPWYWGELKSIIKNKLKWDEVARSVNQIVAQSIIENGTGETGIANLHV